MSNLIKNYIDKITINNINDFAKKNNCFLNKKELNILYEIIKTDYDNILKGYDENSITILKNNLSDENYIKIMNLYTEYKLKYQNYL